DLYLWLLKRLLVIAARRDRVALEFALVATREIPVLSRPMNLMAYRGLLKTLVESFLESSGPDLEPSRRSILRIIGSLVSHWAPKEVLTKGLNWEVLISLRATAMFLTDKDVAHQVLLEDVNWFS